MRRRGLLAAAVLLVVVGAATVKWFLPWLTQDVPVVEATPALPAIGQRAVAVVEPGSTLCIRNVRFTRHSEVAQLRLLARRGRAPELAVTAEGPGYVSRSQIAGYDTGGDVVVQTPLDPPEDPVRGRLCLRNAGDRPVQAVGTSENRSMTLAEPVLDGEALTDRDIELTLLRAEPASVLDRPGMLVDRMAVLTGFLPAALVWLVLLAVVALPLATAWAFVAAARQAPGLADDDAGDP